MVSDTEVMTRGSQIPSSKVFQGVHVRHAHFRVRAGLLSSTCLAWCGIAEVDQDMIQQLHKYQ